MMQLVLPHQALRPAGDQRPRPETGQRRRTLELLLMLSAAYGVPLDDLIGAPDVGDPRIRLKPGRVKGRTVIPLTRQPDGVQAWKIVIPVDIVVRSRGHTRGTSGSTSCRVGCVWCSAGRSGCSDRVTSPSSPPTYRTGSAAPARPPPGCERRPVTDGRAPRKASADPRPATAPSAAPRRLPAAASDAAPERLVHLVEPLTRAREKRTGEQHERAAEGL
jgi:hypothetical protein